MAVAIEPSEVVGCQGVEVRDGWGRSRLDAGMLACCVCACDMSRAFIAGEKTAVQCAMQEVWRLLNSRRKVRGARDRGT